jgi:MFS family permease
VGYLIDRFFAAYVAFPCFILSALGFAILATGAIGWPVFIAAAFLGLSAGAEFDLLAFLTGRYFGLRNFGGIYAFLFIAFLVGASFGPLAYGAVYEQTNSYMWILSISTVLTVIAGLIMLKLPRYPSVE